ncbi:MAG: hypothetical protein ACFFG0_21885 [Candidatus Thorarchaeota archaeon]
MLENIKKLKGSIENALIFLGLTLLTLGFFTLFFAVYIVIGDLFKGWPWVVNGGVLLAIGLTLIYLGNRSTKIKIE